MMVFTVYAAIDRNVKPLLFFCLGPVITTPTRNNIRYTNENKLNRNTVAIEDKRGHRVLNTEPLH